MALVKETLQNTLFTGLRKVLSEQANKATGGDESEDPNDVVSHVAKEMAKVITSAVDDYIKSGDILVGPSNVQVTSASPGSPAVVAPLNPAKMK